MEKLDQRIKNHDKDIERMCNCHYQGFVDCIHELLKVRPQATSLKNEILQVNSELQRSSENIQRKADELIKYRRVVCNTKTAIEHLQECLPVLETFSKLTQQMKEKKYYPALKTLEQFENLYIPKIRKYRFAQSMCQRVPKFRETIKKESMKDLKDFLENIRQLTSKIGEIAMKNVASQHKSKEFAFILNEHTGKEASTNVNEFSAPYNKSNGLVSEKMVKMPASNGTLANNENLEDEYLFINEELSATDIVDFSPVYRCLHIFGCLGAREQFENYYRQQRKQQAKLILQSISSGANSLFTGDNFRNYLFGVVGFFVIEDHLLNTSSGLVTKQYLAENWDDVIKSLVENVHLQASACHDPKQMLYMKSLLMLFCHTTQSYGYSVEPLMKLLVELRQLYIDILLRQWSQVFSSIFDADNYHPLHINSQQEFDEYFSDFPFSEMEIFKNHFTNCVENNSKDAFPKKFPFSSFVPKVYKAVREFIATSLEFTQDLNLSNSDIEDTVRKSTNMLLTRTLSDSLSSLIKKRGLRLLQLIQISINTNYLEEASTYLEIYISELINNKTVTDSNTEAMPSPNKPLNGKDQRYMTLKYSISINNEPSSQSHLARLQGRTMFKDARSEAESQIYIQLNLRIDDFFTLANYDYMLSDSPGKASSYILDLMAFLSSTFEAFTNLPKKVAQTGCLSSCKYIANRLLNILIDEDVKSISHGFLQQFNLDLMQCEMFAGSEPVKEFEEGALQACFTELRQIMDLFIEFDSWSTYFAEYGKNESRYLRVNAQTALALLEKLVRGDSKKTIFSALSKNERDKKNRIETILKKLRQIIASGGSNNN